ncbi:hypothetical protein [Arthrobacter sp. TWP1-1]|uniref:hypothetical protein n=1 Tax=Arthrobacter sp. TWP1-1 TaxID=2804568 RepID=UPI003CF7EEA4
MERLVLIGTVGVVVVVVAYLALRLFVWTSAASKSLEYIRRHALWTGFIAWAFSSLAGANRAGIYDSHMFYPSHWHAIPWFAIFAPVVAVVSVHAIGQATWPAPKATKRTAVLEFRRIRDYVPNALGWTVLGVFLLSAAVMPLVAASPGVEAITSPAPDSMSPWTAGRMNGGPLALVLTLALVLLAAGTLLVMRLITSRRSLEALTPEQNKTLRIIGINRLLRVSATVASGLAAIAGNYLVQPMPGSDVLSFTNWIGLFNVAVLVAMLFWKPPFLDSPTDDAGYNILHVPGTSSKLASGDGFAVAKLSDSFTSITPLAGLVGLCVGLLTTKWFGWLGPLTLVVVFILLAHWGLELLLRHNYARPGTARTQLKAAVPRGLLIVAGLAILALIPALIAATNLNTGGMYDWPGFSRSSPRFLIPLLCALVILGVSAGAAVAVIRRPGLNNAAELLDRTLRRRSLFRVMRTSAGGLLAVLAAVLINLGTAPTYGGPSADSSLVMVGAAFIVAAAVLCFYPVKGFTPNDFMPTAPTNHSVSK